MNKSVLKYLPLVLELKKGGNVLLCCNNVEKCNNIINLIESSFDIKLTQERIYQCHGDNDNGKVFIDDILTNGINNPIQKLFFGIRISINDVNT